MLKQRFFRLSFCLAVVVLFAAGARAQGSGAIMPDLSTAGVRLGDRSTAKAFLGTFQPRIGEDGRPEFLFFNKAADQVLKLTGASFDDRYLITGIEVYKVGKSYRQGHFQAEKISFFKTEKDIFVGYKQSTASAITGIPNVDGKDRTGAKTIVKKIGEPTERKTDGDRETLIYRLPSIDITDETGKTSKYVYSAVYEFNEGKLKRFAMAISPVN